MFIIADTESGKNHTFANLHDVYQWVSTQIKVKEDKSYVSFVTQLKAHIDAFLELQQNPVKMKPEQEEKSVAKNTTVELESNLIPANTFTEKDVHSYVIPVYEEKFEKAFPVKTEVYQIWEETEKSVEKYLKEESEQDKEVKALTSLTSDKLKYSLYDYYSYKTPTNHTLDIKSLQKDCNILFQWFLERYTVPNPRTHDGNIDAVQIEDVHNCWKLFLLNPDFSQESYLVTVPLNLKYIFQQDKGILETLHFPIPNNREMKFDGTFIQYKSFCDKIPSNNFGSQIRKELYKLLVGCILDKKVHPTVMSSWVRYFNLFIVRKKEGSFIEFSKMYEKFLDFMKHIFGSDEEIWTIISTSIDTRFFAHHMSITTTKLCRHENVLMYKGVEFEKAM